MEHNLEHDLDSPDSTSRPERTPFTNGTAAAALSDLTQRIPAEAKRLEKQAVVGIKKATSATLELAKKHPYLTAGVLVGAGVAVGVGLQRALHREPTFGELLLRGLKRGASGATKRIANTAMSGLSMGSHRARRALR